MSALFVAAACGGGGGGAPEGGGTTAPQLISPSRVTSSFGPARTPPAISPKLIAKFNESHPNGKVTLHELPDEADQQRQQMIQNTQIKNPKMAVLNVDVVWTAEFAANSYVEALPPDQFPTDGMLKPTSTRRPTSTSSTPIRAPPTAACSFTARISRQVQPASRRPRSMR